MYHKKNIDILEINKCAFQFKKQIIDLKLCCEAKDMYLTGEIEKQWNELLLNTFRCLC